LLIRFPFIVSPVIITRNKQTRVLLAKARHDGI